jgi:uncharacterized RDD family membrane protein YckC
MEQYKPLNYASTGQRFSNFIIDFIVNYIVAVIFLAVLIVIDTQSPFGFTELVLDESFSGKLKMYLLGYALSFLWFFMLEGATKGRTLGKLLTRTKAVKADGSPISWKDAAIRSISRLIPFEPFSAFSGSGLWHDRLSKTEVIKTR